MGGSKPDEKNKSNPASPSLCFVTVILPALIESFCFPFSPSPLSSNNNRPNSPTIPSSPCAAAGRCASAANNLQSSFDFYAAAPLLSLLHSPSLNLDPATCVATSDPPLAPIRNLLAAQIDSLIPRAIACTAGQPKRGHLTHVPARLQRTPLAYSPCALGPSCCGHYTPPRQILIWVVIVNEGGRLLVFGPAAIV